MGLVNKNIKSCYEKLLYWLCSRCQRNIDLVG